jgi:DNA-directed RNA polymerase subunit RPC12/RpoP
MFGPYSNKKALCGCGALIDLDTDVIRRKRGLGKRVECTECRNRRIAKEHEMLEKHFLGLEEESW